MRAWVPGLPAHKHERMLDSLMSGVCSPSDAGDLAVCNDRSLDVLWLRVRGGPVRTCRVHFRCQRDMHRLQHCRRKLLPSWIDVKCRSAVPAGHVL